MQRGGILMIRHAELKDIIPIKEIYNDAILHTTSIYTYDAYTDEDQIEWYLQRMKQGYPVFVWEEDNQVAGFSTYSSFRSKPAYQYTVENSIYVNRNFRGRGIARTLLQRLIIHAESQGFATMVAAIDSCNTASIRLHEGLGFKRSGIIQRAGYKFGRWLDMTFYQRALESPVLPENSSPADKNIFPDQPWK